MDSVSTAVEAPKKPRLWPALAIPLLSAAGCLLTWLYSPVIMILWMAFALLGSLAWLLWVLRYSRLNIKGKMAFLLVPILLVGALSALLRVDYFDGNTIPVFVWRWTKVPVIDVQIKEQAKDKGVDLVTTTSLDVPEFLGPGRLPVFRGINLDRDWTKNPPKELWRQSIGEGYGSYAVVGEYAVTQQQKEDRELVVCYHWPTGEARWVHSDKARYEFNVAGIGPRSTPTIHKGKVYTVGATGILNCLDGKDGRLIWSHRFIAENNGEVPTWGKSCAPLLYDDVVVVSAGGPDGKSLVAYHKDTGELVWSGGSEASSYSAPTLVTLEGTRQVLIANTENLTAHDAKTGKVLWLHSTSIGGNCSQPFAISKNEVFLSKGYGIGSMLFKVTLQKDGAWDVERVWKKSRVLKTKFTNPVFSDGYAYGISAGSAIQCADPKTGKVQWRQKGKYGHGQMILVDDLLLIQTEWGKIILVEANPKEYKELTSFQALSSRTWNYPVLIGPHLLTRNDREAVCYKLPVKAP
jgi:outer membrane protein assembly factor BamB